MASVSIPVIGTKKYRNAFNSLARDMGSNMATLVRAALDEKYGEALEPYLTFFDASGNHDDHSVTPVKTDA